MADYCLCLCWNWLSCDQVSTLRGVFIFPDMVVLLPELVSREKDCGNMEMDPAGGWGGVIFPSNILYFQFEQLNTLQMISTFVLVSMLVT